MSKMERKNMDGRHIGTDENGDGFLRSLAEEETDNADGINCCDLINEVRECVDSIYDFADDAYDAVSSTMKVTEDNCHAIGGLYEEIIKIVRDQDSIKKAIAGIFRVQVILSVIFFCVHHKLVPVGGKMRDR